MNSKPSEATTQTVLEDYFREEYRIVGCDYEETEAMIADFRQSFAGQHNHPPSPLLIAMIKAELQESTDFVEKLKRITNCE